MSNSEEEEIARDFNGLYFSDKSVLKITEKFLQENLEKIFSCITLKQKKVNIK